MGPPSGGSREATISSRGQPVVPPFRARSPGGAGPGQPVGAGPRPRLWGQAALGAAPKFMT